MQIQIGRNLKAYRHFYIGKWWSTISLCGNKSLTRVDEDQSLEVTKFSQRIHENGPNPELRQEDGTQDQDGGVHPTSCIPSASLQYEKHTKNTHGSCTMHPRSPFRSYVRKITKMGSSQTRIYIQNVRQLCSKKYN